MSEKNIRRDMLKILFLLLLYFIQGIVTGLFNSLQFILRERKISYVDQGVFFLSSYPLSYKLLWAPFVDAVFWNRFGRRKSWLVPIQYAIGLFLILFAPYVYRILGEKDSDITIHDEIFKLFCIFTMLNMLVATQDIIVDAWSLTLLSDLSDFDLKRENIEWSSICKNAGTTFGMLTGHPLFLALESATISNHYFRILFDIEEKNYGLINLKEFMVASGVLFIICTTLILLFINEKSGAYSEDETSILSTYRSLWEILKLKPIQKFLLFLLTWNIPFALSKLNTVKIQEAGVSKEILSIINVPFQIIQVIIGIFIGKFVSNGSPLEFYMKVYPIKMVVAFILGVLVYLVSFHQGNFLFFLAYSLFNGALSFMLSLLIVSKGYFFAQISDKTIGATYLALLHTFSNIGYIWPTLFSYYIIESFTIKNCVRYEKFSNHTKSFNGIFNNTCSNRAEIKDCHEFSGKCVITREPFYLLMVIFLGLGIIWYMFLRGHLKKLQSMPSEAWQIRPKDSLTLVRL